MATLVPSVLSADWSILADELIVCEQCGITIVHFDIMDGMFVPNISFGDKFISDVRQKFSSIFFDVHLMVRNPARYIDVYAAAGANALTFHIEEERFLYRAAQAVRAHGCAVGLAVNPQTPVEAISHVLDELDTILIMSVDPGFGGQTFIEQSLQKIAALHELRTRRNLHFTIGVDGGVNAKNAEKIAAIGADNLIMGSAFFSSNDKAALAKSVASYIR